MHSCLYVLCEQRRALTLDHHLCRVLGGLASGLLSRCPEEQALFACDGGSFWGGTPREQTFEQLSLVMETAGPFAYPSNPHSNLPDPGCCGRSWLSAPQEGDMMRPQGHMFLNRPCQQGLGLPADDSGQEPLGLGLEALPAKEPPGRLHREGHTQNRSRAEWVSPRLETPPHTTASFLSLSPLYLQMRARGNTIGRSFCIYPSL